MLLSPIHVNSVSTPISVEFDMIVSASCATLSSASLVTIITSMIVEAMRSSSGLPAGYITVMGPSSSVDNTCASGRKFRLRSLFRLLQQLPPTLNVKGDGTATIKITITWPAEVVTFTGLTSAQADLIVANCTSHQALSSFFTPSVMAAYEMRSTPDADIVQSSVRSNLSSNSVIRGK